MTSLYRWIRARPIVSHLLILFALWLLFFWRYFIPGPNRMGFPDGDFTQQFFIFRSVAFQQFTSGHFPLWANCFFGGYPFHADPQSQLFYPPVWITFSALRLLGFSDFPLIALTVETISHYLAISVFAYLFLREESGSRIAALVGALVLTYGGYLTGYPPLQTSVIETATWMPLLLLALRRFSISGSGRAAAVAVSIYALAFLAGHPQTFLLVTYLSIGYFLFRARSAGRRWAWILLWLLVIVVLVLLVISTQLLPQTQFLHLSTRTSLPFDQLARGFVPQDIVQFILTKLGSNDLWQPLYVGVLGLTLAIMTLPLRRDAVSRFWLITGLIALLISFGSNMALYNLAYWLLPFFRLFRGQERAAVLIAMAASTLIALTVTTLTGPLQQEHLKTLNNTRRWLRNMTPLALTLLILAVVLAQHDPVSWSHIPSRFGLLMIGLLLSILALATCSYQRWFPTALATVVALELFSANMATNAVPLSDPYPELPLLEVMQSDDASGRWFRVQDDARMQGHWACAYGLHEWGGISPIRLQTWNDFDSHAPEHARFRLLGIDYLISWKMDFVTREGIPLQTKTLYHGTAPSGEAKVYRLSGDAQRAWLPEIVQHAPSKQALWEMMAIEGFDVHQNALLLAPSQAMDSSKGHVKLLSERPGRIELQVHNKLPALLVVSEAWYPGWVATTNAGSAPTELVSGYIQGVHLQHPGPQHVLLEYQPTIFRWGMTGSALGLLLTLMLYFLKREART